MLKEAFAEQTSLLKDNMLLRSKNHTKSLAIQLENELAVYNFSKFEELVIADATKNENITYIEVLDKDGNVIVHSQDANLPSIHFSSQDIYSNNIDINEILNNGHPMLVLKKTLYLGTEPWGVITLYFTQAELEEKVLNYSKQMQERIHRSLFESLLYMTIFFLLSLPFAYSMALHISNPIINLTKRAEELANGNFTPKSIPAENRKDELALLEKTFNKMSENLENSYNKLADYNTQLEQMVLSRTLELEEKNIELEKLSITDRLTQLYNRVKLEEVFIDQIQSSRRYSTPFSILLCDIDYFKRVNDTFGHIIGDKVLIEIANILQATIRETDIVGRWGGEEFLVICSGTDKENAMQLAERLRKAIELYPFVHNQQQTLSIGVSSFSSDDSDMSMLSRADSALYLAKNNGRNNTVFTAS
jgi:diguanylate cyclase (GGDEF)-like protein